MQPAVLYSSAAAVLTFHKKSNSAVLEQLMVLFSSAKPLDGVRSNLDYAYSVELCCGKLRGHKD